MSPEEYTLDHPLDPLTYIGRVYRRNGKVRIIEVVYDDETVHMEDGDEFVTFTTRILLEG